MESAVMEDKKAGVGAGVLIIALVGAWYFASRRIEGTKAEQAASLQKLAAAATMTPTAAATTQPGTQPASDPAAGLRQLISEIPPPDVQTHYLGAGMTYAKFSSPIDVGSGFKQWGVTTEGYPVVSTKPPDQYSAWDWI